MPTGGMAADTGWASDPKAESLVKVIFCSYDV
jgi:hypothetical protein